MNGFDSIVLIGYGAPEKAEDVPEFLQIVAKGFAIPEARMKEVEGHYREVGGGSPLNELTKRQGEAMRKILMNRGVDLPVYMAMRNWRPFTDDTVAEMARRGHKKCAALIMALHQCDTSWQRYQREIEDAKAKAGAEIEFAYPPPLFDNPLFIQNCADRVTEQIAKLPEERLSESAKLIFTAHSIPLDMPGSGVYEKQFLKTCELTARELSARGLGAEDFTVAWQSRSGSPSQKWFEPDICDVIDGLGKNVSHIVVQPIGFVCDHVEVLYDIGVEAASAARRVGIELLVAKTVNDDEKFARAMAEAVLSLAGRK